MSDPCNRCQRKGLAILPVIYAAAPKEDTALPPLGGHFGPGVTDKALKENRYYLRRLDPGYIYLLYPNKVWKGYLIDVAGYPRYYPDLMIEDMPATLPAQSDVTRCQTQTENPHSGVEAICIDRPDKLTGPVWIAYSRHHWTKAVRAAHANAPEKRMQKIGAVDGSAFEHAEVASAAAMKQWIADYKPSAVQMLNKRLPAANPVIDRSGDAENLAAAMLAMSGKLAKPGLIMALHDPVGITATLNSARNDITEQVLLIDKNLSAKDRDDLLIAGIVEDIRKSMQAAKDNPWERYAKHIDNSKLDPVLKKLQAKRDLAKRIDTCSSDYVVWITAPRLTDLFASDFDPSNVASGLALENCFVLCTAGSGVTMQEREKVWQPWFDKDPKDPTNLLWQAATAADKSVLAFLAVEKIDKTFDLTKGSKDIFKEREWFAHLHDVLHAANSQRAQQRAYAVATEKIAVTLAAQLIWLRGKDGSGLKKYHQTAARMATILASRGDIVVLPKTMTARVHQYVRWVQDAYIGKPSARIPLVQGNVLPGGGGKRIDPNKLNGEELRKTVSNMDGPLMVDLSGRDGVMNFSLWVAQKLQPGQAPDKEMEKLLRRLKLEPDDLTLSADLKINPLTDLERKVGIAKMDRAFSAGTGFLTLYSFYNTWNQLTDELKKGKDADALALESGFASVGTAALTGIAVTMEIKAANELIKQAGVETLRIRVLSGMAAGLGLACGLVDAYYLWKQSEKLSKDGDKDAAEFTFFSSLLTGGSAIFIGLAGIAAAFGATGVGIPIAVGIGLLLAMAAMATGYSAAENTDTELEKWVDRCRYGKRIRTDSKSAYRDGKEEITAFRNAIYVVSIKMRISWQAGILKGFYTISVPYFAKHSAIRVQLSAKDTLGTTRVLKSSLFKINGEEQVEKYDSHAAPVSSADGKVQDKQLLIEGEMTLRLPPQDLFRDPDQRGKQFIRVGSVAKDVTDVAYFDNLNVSVTYQPDKKTWPEFVVENQA
ncbi:T6SS effector BTH_I2691 family protein [Chitinimonas sp. PSY-7]|uniref:T6SS effector BTH_I2691 family protein n=1 Tax=Chitinimonas sp. PSY-7 TaxID=3459088 RepID=UPI004040230C